MKFSGHPDTGKGMASMVGPAEKWRSHVNSTDTVVEQAWRRLAEVSESERAEQMRARYTELASLDDEQERSNRLLAMMHAEYALPDDQLRAFTLGRLRTFMGMDSEAVGRIVHSLDTVMRQMPGTAAMRRVALVQTLTREFTPEEQHQLREMMPQVFGDQPITPPPAPATPVAAATSKPWWAFWRKA
jgi:hypothetical protein